MSDGTVSVLVILTVPDHWPRLTESEITRKLKANPQIFGGLASEIKRWGNANAIDLAGLQRFIDDRTGGGNP